MKQKIALKGKELRKQISRTFNSICCYDEKKYEMSLWS
jgi:hypothetical protein